MKIILSLIYHVIMLIINIKNHVLLLRYVYFIRREKEVRSFSLMGYILSYSKTLECSLELEELFTEYTQDGRIKWTWCLIFIYLVPECIGVLNTLWHYLFKRKPRMPKKRNILLMILIDTLHTLGLVLLTFIILPEIGAVQGAAIFCCLCFVPGLLSKCA